MTRRIDLTNQTVELPDELLGQEPTFVARYWLVAEIIAQLTDQQFKSNKIIDIGGNGSLLPKLLDYDIDILDLPESDYPSYLRGSALDMPIKDGAYDIVTSCDVYEHIPAEDRERFISEMLRICGQYAILCGPMYKDETAEAERRANDFFKRLFGYDHPWLKEHIANGLPEPDRLEASLTKLGLDYFKFDHGNLLTWEALTEANFLEVDNQLSKQADFIEILRRTNQRYLEELKSIDFCEDGYRTIYVIAKPGLHLPDFQLPSYNPEVVQASLISLMAALGSLAAKARDVGSLAGQLDSERRTNETLKGGLDAILASTSWRMTRPLRFVTGRLKRSMRKLGLFKFLKQLRQVIVGLIKHIPFLARNLRRLRAHLFHNQLELAREREYQAWLVSNFPDEAELARQRRDSAAWTNRPLVSVVVPTYNTNLEHLRVCLQSVLDQSYDRWELCIADDASTDRGVKLVLEEFASKDKRIKYVIRKANGHICEATNSALGLARGEFVALLDHDDYLWPNALYEMVDKANHNPNVELIYSDEDKIDEEGRVHSQPFFKPDWSPDYLRSVNYITHFTMIRKKIVERAGGFRPGYEGAQDWDLFLRIANQTDKIQHVQTILYSWRKTQTSTALAASAKRYAYDNQRKVLLDDARARGLKVESIGWGIPNLIWKINYGIEGQPKVSIIIPTKDKFEYISRCLSSLYIKTAYQKIEVIIVDTGSSDPRVWSLYEAYKSKLKHLKVLKWSERFNFALVCNFGAEHASGDYLLFLNNDTEVISRDWVTGLLQFAQQPHVGAVGCKLLYPDETLQHAGVVLGIGGNGSTPGVAAHLFPAYQDQPPQDQAQDVYVGGARDFSAVTAACLMVSKPKFEQVGGFDGMFEIAWNDVDFCLKLRQAGWYNVFNPFVKLYHHESVSVGKLGSAVRDLDLFNKEISLFGERWGWDYINNDPYYSPHFRRDIANARLAPVPHER